MTDYMGALKQFRMKTMSPAADAGKVLREIIAAHRKALESGKKAGSLSQDAQQVAVRVIALLEEQIAAVAAAADNNSAFAAVKKDFDARVKSMKKQAEEAGKKLSNAFRFCEEVFGDGQEMLILVTELTINPHSAMFISKYGCNEYFAHNKELLFHERQMEILSEIDRLQLN